MRIAILGPLEVRSPDRTVEIGGARLRALLTLLALEAGRTVPAERLIDGLWEERPPAAAANALQSLVSRLRAALDRQAGPSASGAGRDLIESQPTGYRLMLPRSSVDAFEFEAKVAAARGSGDPVRISGELRDALELWRGPALADVRGAAFAEGPTARLEALRLTALEERVEADLTLARHAELIPELQALAAAHPTRERLHGQLMRALYGAGRQADALAVFAQVRELLGESLGVDPGPELADIHLAVLRGDPRLLPMPRPTASAAPGVPVSTAPAAPAVIRPALPPPPGPDPSAAPGFAVRHPAVRDPAVRDPAVRDPAVRDLAAPDDAVRQDTGTGPGRSLDVPYRPKTNLRSRLTSFIGRGEDLAEVTRLLTATRFVTLTGPGGAGKTRLAVEASEPLVARVPDGVWFVDLSAANDPAEVPHAVLTAIGLRELVLVAGTAGRAGAAEPGDPLDRLAGVLAGQHLLLVLDNCEHLVDAAARLADRLLAACPGVRILATSREPLGITGETLWPVEPLPLPAENAGVDEAMACPAVRLFADRATAVRPGFQVTAANVGAVTRICRALDGMPLAIELSAARLRALTPGQVAARLDDRFRLLAAGSRTALPRHQTLRAVVEWSWDLLDEPERVLLRRLAIFGGGATLDSAETVCAGPGLPADTLLDVLAALVDKSLVTVVMDEESEAEPRYRMLETIRAFGMERLAQAGEEEKLRRAHAAYFLALAERAEPELRGRDQLDWLDRLGAEHENLHAAFRCALNAGDAALALRLCASLGWYWFLRGHRAEAADAISAVLALPDLPAGPATALVYGYGVLTGLGESHDLGRLKDRMSHAIDIIEGLDDEREAGGPGYPMLRLLEPMFALFAGRMAEPELQRLEPILTDRDPWLRAMGNFMYAQVSINAGRSADISGHFEAALAGFREAGDRWGTAFTLSGLAEVRAWRGEHRASVALFEESLGLIAQLSSGEEAFYIHMRMANGLWALGETERATELLTSSLRTSERMGQPTGSGAVLYQLGEFARRQDDRVRARHCLDRALALVTEREGPLQFRALVHSTLGLVDAADGELERARERHIEALRLGAASWDAPVIATTVLGFADVALRLGSAGQAAELLGAAEGIRGLPDLSSPLAGELSTAVREELGGHAFDRAFTRGRSMSIGDVLDLLGLERPPSISIIL